MDNKTKLAYEKMNPLMQEELALIHPDLISPVKAQISFPIIDEHGNPHKNHWKNTEALCKSLGINFRYNEMTKEVEADHKDFINLSFDSKVTELRGLGIENGYKLSKSEAADHIGRIAEENSYHPVRVYLLECKKSWDGKSRIRNVFDMFELDPSSDQDPEFAFTLFRKWIITCAKLPFNIGNVSAQGILVLVGPQGIGKTRWMLNILPNQDWGKEGLMIDTKNKDTVMQALSYWIVELGEYGRSLNAEKMDHYKAFITSGKDTFRVPYARTADKYPRTTVFYATTDTDSFLKDEAGERRNWCISISGIKNIELDVDQLWGEAAHLAFDENASYWLTKDEIAMLNHQNGAYKVRNEYYELLYTKFDWLTKRSEWILLTATDICKLLDIDTNRSGRIGSALNQMTELGVHRKTKSNNGPKVYIVPPFIDGYSRIAAIKQAERYNSTVICQSNQ